MKRISILCYSLTGNTNLVSHKIAEALESFRKPGEPDAQLYQCEVLGIVGIVRRRFFQPSMPPHDEERVYSKLKESDIIGVGVPVFYGQPPAGVANWLAEVLRYFSLFLL